MKTEKMPLSSSKADDIIFDNFQPVADQAIDLWLLANPWCQGRGDAWSLMMNNYDVEFVSENNVYKSVTFLPK
jgi:hypothetical protein